MLDSATTFMIAEDGFNGPGQPTAQGRGQESINYFWDQTVSAFQDQIGRRPGSQGTLPGQTPQDTFNDVCSVALQDAADRATSMGYPATAAESRVVAVYFSYAVGSVEWFMSSVSAAEYSSSMDPSWSNEVNNPALPGFTYDNSREAYAAFQQDGMSALDALGLTLRAHVDAVIAQQPVSGRYFNCIALNEQEPQVGFEVTVTTQATPFTTPGGRAEDEIWVDLKSGYAWPSGATLTGEVVAYPAGAGDPEVSGTAPVGAEALGSASVTLTGAGRENSAKVSIPVGDYDGRVTFVVIFRAADQADGLLLSDATHEYGLKNETTVVPSALGGASQVTIKGGQEAKDAATLEDTFTSAPLEGDLWPAGPDGTTPVSATYRWTAYRLDETIPAETTDEVPATAVKIETGTVTASGPGEVLRAQVPNPYYGVPDSGSVIWWWELLEEDQDAAMLPYIVPGWFDGFAVETEITHVPAIAEVVTSASVRHTAGGTFFVDDIFKGRFPSDYGDYDGSLGFTADEPDLTHEMLWFPAGLDVTEANRAQAELIGSVKVSASNGFEGPIGSTSFLVPGTAPGETCQAGVAVFTTSHPGSARLLPLSTTVEDTTEQYPVTCEDEQPSIDVEKADDVATGEGNGTDPADNAGSGDHDTAETAKVVNAGEETVITVTLTNNGTETLTKVWVSDETLSGAPMVVNDGSFVVVDADGTDLYSVAAGTLTATQAASGKYGFTVAEGAALRLAAGQSIRFTGTVPAQQAGDEPHANRASVGGTGEVSGVLVGDSDDYYTVFPTADEDIASAAADEDTARALAITGGQVAGLGVLAVALLAGGVGFVVYRRRSLAKLPSMNGPDIP